MTTTRRRMPAKYKQMAFDTAVRNPERYIDILTTLYPYEGVILDDENLLEIVSDLYLNRIFTSPKIQLDENTTIDDIKELVIEVNQTRNADGGFPRGYPSRFWTYMRTPSELGFVYAQYGEKLRFSEIAKKLINREIDEQEAFSIQAMKHNRRNPYRNVLNDFNFFRFIINVLLKLREQGKRLNYGQFIVAMFSQNGDVDKFLNLLENHRIYDEDTAYNFVREHYNVTNKKETVTQDYPDVVRRVFIIAGFITVRYEGIKLIQLNENKLDYIQELLSIDFTLTEEEKENPWQYFQKLDGNNQPFFDLIIKYRERDKINGTTYRNQLLELIDTYKIDEETIVKSIKNISKRRNVIEEFKDIPEPLKLEFYIAILIALKYGDEFAIRPNYKADHLGKPYSHAPGNKGDIEVFSDYIYWLIEVTLIRNRNQQLNHETTNVIRHLISSEEFANRVKKYLSLIAPIIHPDVRDFFNYSIVRHRTENQDLYIKPYPLEEFVDKTIKKEIFRDMEIYTQQIINEFRQNLN